MNFTGEARRFVRLVAEGFPGVEVYDAARGAWRTIRIQKPKEEEDDESRGIEH